MHMPSPNTVAPAQGLYQPDEFKDNCGFGLIAHMQGDASHDLVKTAIHSLSCMTHRGGIAADGKTGDGCGLLLAMPKAFFREEAKKLSDITLSEIFAVGTIFFNLDPAIAVPAFINVNDETNEGLAYTGKNIFTVQFHPEACPGPQDSDYLFDRFIEMMEVTKNA